MYQSALNHGADKIQLNNVLHGLVSGAISGTTGFRVGEYNAQEASHSPFTEEDYKKPAFKYFKDSGLELPNTSLNSEEITNEEQGTKKTVADYPKKVQDQYQKEHKNQLEEILKPIVSGEQTVFIKSYKDAKGQPITKVTIDEPDEGDYKEVNVKKLDKDQKAQLLSLAQKMATKATKEQIFGDETDNQ